MKTSTIASPFFPSTFRRCASAWAISKNWPIAFAGKFRPGVSLTREAFAYLAQHSWPGNVRELRNVIERATILVGSEHEIKPEHIIL